MESSPVKSTVAWIVVLWKVFLLELRTNGKWLVWWKHVWITGTKIKMLKSFCLDGLSASQAPSWPAPTAKLLSYHVYVYFHRVYCAARAGHRGSWGLQALRLYHTMPVYHTLAAAQSSMQLTFVSTWHDRMSMVWWGSRDWLCVIEGIALCFEFVILYLRGGF